MAVKGCGRIRMTGKALQYDALLGRERQTYTALARGQKSLLDRRQDDAVSCTFRESLRYLIIQAVLCSDFVSFSVFRRLGLKRSNSCSVGVLQFTMLPGETLKQGAQATMLFLTF